MKMTSLKKSSADRKADERERGGFSLPEGAPEHDGLAIHLEPHHLEKMGLAGKLKGGDGFELHGKGYVHRTESISDKDGDDHHRAHLIMTHGGMEHESHNHTEADREDVRRDVDHAFEEAEKGAK